MLEYHPSTTARQVPPTLADVWIDDGELYNEEMILMGYAHEYTYRKPYRLQTQFRAAQDEAKREQRGFWSPDTCNGNTTQPQRSATPVT